MKKNLIFILIFCFYSISFSNIEYQNIEEDYYIKLAYNEPIGNLVTVENFIVWFSKQTEKVSIIINKNKNYYSIKYCFQDRGKQAGSLELQYDNKNNCKLIILQMIINGTPKYYENNDAKRILRMFISYNDTFDYYIEN